jgi:hypothetical protein
LHTELFIGLVTRLASGILAVQADHRPVPPAEALGWAVAAAVHAGQADVDPFELVGIARNESDFRPRRVGPDGKDCGLLQTRVTYSRYRCGQLRADPGKAFEEGARRLADYDRHCRKTRPHDRTRCRLNRYNQGYRYRTAGHKGAYWLRVSCFAQAARDGVAPRGDCRKARSPADIARLIYGVPELATR